MKKRTTLRDVAKAAKVHFTTVGLAVRGDRRLDPKTAARILAIAEQMEYRSDPLLSALSAYRTRRRTVFHGNIGYIFTMPMAEVKPGTLTAYQTAREHARRLGFSLDPFHLSTKPGATGALQRILHARGIQAVILSPLEAPGTYPPLDWTKLCVVAIGQSISTPQFHRVCNHQSHSMRAQLARLRALGYRRIGLAFSNNGTIRTEHNYLGAYLAEQQFLPLSDRLPPLFFDRAEIDELARWIEGNRPDCIISSEEEIYGLLRRLGLKLPQQLGFSTVAHMDDRPDLAGPVEHWAMIGEAAVDLVISLLGKRDYGIPKSPLTLLIENKTWHHAKTIREPAKARM